MVGYLESVLEIVCKKLQLPENLYNLAVERYNTIAKTIQQDSEFCSEELNFYSQGSFRLQTTVKPLSNAEFDLDFVAEIRRDTKMMPEQLYRGIVRVLRSDGIHKDMVELKSRCIRVVYANDFHLDIMPGKLLDSSTREIIVPDREKKQWYHHSNPKAYADWFESRAKQTIQSAYYFSERLRENVEPLSDQQLSERLEPLRRAVQLIKRYRDVYCDKTKKEPVRSIVICTLMGEINSNYSSVVQIVQDFCSYVNQRILVGNGEPFEVRNPVVNELLTEKWKENKQNYKDFVSMMNELTNDFRMIISLKNTQDLNTLLKKMFGEEVIRQAILSYADKITEQRNEGKLRVNSTGNLGNEVNGTPIKKNTFYGQKT